MTNNKKQSVLVVVKTPMQLLNAIEYLYVEGINTETVDLFMVNDYIKYSKTLDDLSKKWVWNKKIKYTLFYTDYIIGNLISSILTRMSPYLFFNKNYDNIVVGHYSQPIQRYFLRKKKGIKILVDDGIQTLNFNTLRMNEIENGIIETYGPDKTNTFINKIWNFQKVIKNSLTVFTSFSIEPNDFDYLMNNDFKYFKSQIKDFKDLNAIVFIGSDIVEAGGIEKNEYLNALSKVLTIYRADKIIYIPKKTEDIGKLENIIEKIEIRKLGYPIELFPIIEGLKPKGFASLFSSAIFNLSKIYGNSLEYSLIDIRAKVKKDIKFDFVFKAYEYQENIEGINILN